MRIKGRHAAGLLALAALAMPVAAVWAGVSATGHTTTPPAAASTPAVVPRLTSGHIIFGVASGSISRWDKATGTRASLAVFYVSMAKPISPHFVSWARARSDGAEPVIDVLPVHRSLRNIASGKGDRWLRKFRAQITAPIVVSFAPEANGAWYSWGVQPVAFRAAWRHVHHVLGTRHITWLWQMSARPSRSRYSPSRKYGIADYWPGRSYVSWIGIDGYFVFPADTFSRVFSAAIHTMRRLGRRPVLISETSVGPGARHVTRDIASLIANARSWHLIGFIWFDGDQNKPPYHQDWNLENRPKALAAFRKAAQQ